MGTVQGSSFLYCISDWLGKAKQKAQRLERSPLGWPWPDPSYINCPQHDVSTKFELAANIFKCRESTHTLPQRNGISGFSGKMGRPGDTTPCPPCGNNQLETQNAVPTIGAGTLQQATLSICSVPRVSVGICDLWENTFCFWPASKHLMSCFPLTWFLLLLGTFLSPTNLLPWYYPATQPLAMALDSAVNPDVNWVRSAP